MGDIADNRNFQAVQPPIAVLHGEHIKQPLRGMLMGSVTGVDDRTVDLVRQKIVRTGYGMTHNDDVRLHCQQIQGCIGKRFALGGRTGRRCDIDGIGRKPLAGDFKRGAGARRCFVEQVDDCLAAQCRHLLDIATVDLPHVLGG